MRAAVHMMHDSLRLLIGKGYEVGFFNSKFWETKGFAGKHISTSEGFNPQRVVPNHALTRVLDFFPQGFAGSGSSTA